MRAFELFFVAALILYTFVIWRHKRTKELRCWMVALFGIGVIADILGTVLLCFVSAREFRLTLHAVSGFASLLIMAFHFIWALLAVFYVGNFESYFRRFSVYAWYLWLISFISGIPLI